MKNENKLVLIDMETGLAKDHAGMYKKEVLQKLIDAKTELKRRMDKGLDPEEYAPLNAFKGSLDAAYSIVDRLWNSQH
jgi:hypothetical protein